MIRSRMLATTGKAIRPRHIAHVSKLAISALAAVLGIEVAANSKDLASNLHGINTT